MYNISNKIIMNNKESRIKYRRENWKPFGNIQKMSSSIGEEVEMELLYEPLFRNNEKVLNNEVSVSNDEIEFGKIDYLFLIVFEMDHGDWRKDKNARDKMLDIIYNKKVKEYMDNCVKHREFIKMFTEEYINEPKKDDVKTNNENKAYKINNLVEEKVDKMNLFIENIPININEEDLFEYFSNYGRIKRVKILTDKNTGKSRGIGFVNVYSENTSNYILNNYKRRPLGHSILKIQYAEKKK